MLERMKFASAENGEGIGKVEKFIEEATDTYRAEGIPVNTDGRIDMTAYRGIHKTVDKDIRRNREWEEIWFGNISEEDAREKRRARSGEQLEILAHAIFLKNLGEDFVVVRSSPHDDRVNKVDTLILDRKTGTLVCAFDEVGDTMGIEYQRKLQSVQTKNLKGGAKLRYGIAAKTEGGERTVVPTSAEHIPVFYIAVPSDRVRKGIQEFVTDPINQSEFEERLFKYFVATITSQIQGLELYNGRLNPVFKEKLSEFKRIMNLIMSRQQEIAP